MKKGIIAGLSFAFVPTFLVLATGHDTTMTNIDGVVTWVTGILNVIVTLLIALAVFYIIWGVFEFVQSAGDPEKRSEGRDRMIYGLIGVVVMLSIYGILNIFVGSVGVDTTFEPTAPIIL